MLASSVSSISIDHLRKEGPDSVCMHLCSLKKVCILPHSFIFFFVFERSTLYFILFVICAFLEISA